jgi:spermidine synthase
MKPRITLAEATLDDGSPLELQEHDGRRYLLVQGQQICGPATRAAEEELAKLAAAPFRPARQPRVWLIGLGLGHMLKSIMEQLPQKRALFTVAENREVLIDWNREFLTSVNGLLVDDPRVRIHRRDVNDLIEKAGKDRYHAILLDVDNSPDPLVQKGNARLYNRGGLERTKAALHSGGRVVFWSANPDKDFARSLERVFKNVQCIGAKAYPKAKRFTHTLFVAERE